MSQIKTSNTTKASKTSSKMDSRKPSTKKVDPAPPKVTKQGKAPVPAGPTKPAKGLKRPTNSFAPKPKSSDKSGDERTSKVPAGPKPIRRSLKRPANLFAQKSKDSSWSSGSETDDESSSGSSSSSRQKAKPSGIVRMRRKSPSPAARDSPSARRLVDDDERDEWLGVKRPHKIDRIVHSGCIISGRPDWDPSTEIDRDAPMKQLPGSRMGWKEYLAKAAAKNQQSRQDPSSPRPVSTNKSGRKKPIRRDSDTSSSSDELSSQEPLKMKIKGESYGRIPFYDLPAAGIRNHKEIGVPECLNWDFPQKEFSPKTKKALPPMN